MEDLIGFVGIKVVTDNNRWNTYYRYWYDDGSVFWVKEYHTSSEAVLCPVRGTPSSCSGCLHLQDGVCTYPEEKFGDEELLEELCELIYRHPSHSSDDSKSLIIDATRG